MLAARAIGLDCGPMSGFDSDKVDAKFFPDGQLKSNFLCNLGRVDARELPPANPRFEFDEVCNVIESFASANLKGSKSYRGVKGLAEPPVLWKLPLSRHTAHGLPCCRLAPVANNPLQKCQRLQVFLPKHITKLDLSE
jgi:hypothetical protein